MAYTAKFYKHAGRSHNKRGRNVMKTVDRVAIVTGAGSGIGKAVAIGLLNNGYKVSVAGRREEPLKKAVKESGASSDRFLIVSADVTKPGEVRELFRKTVDKFGRLDLLFNNAGIGAPAVPIEELAFEQWQSVVDVNLTGVFLCAQEAIRQMKHQVPQGGRIINNGSISAQSPRPYTAPYTATKHAITGLTKSISLDCRKFNIACSQIDIGNAKTDMTLKMAAGIIQANGEIVSEPLMDIEHVVSAVLYMAGLPLEANVQFMTIMATTMPLIGRG
jgi:NAD(P)-dependent dehydrogenase (short-subunit alcohol dehydrogenase family)